MEADDLREVATRLTDSLIRFEQWLASQGRFEVQVRHEETVLSFARDGSRGWRIYTTIDENVRLLVEASLAEKMKAIDALPALVRAVEVARESQIKELKKANAALDCLFRTLNIATVDEKPLEPK